MLDSSTTTPFVFYLLGMICLITIVTLVNLVSDQWSPCSVWSPWSLVSLFCSLRFGGHSKSNSNLYNFSFI